MNSDTKVVATLDLSSARDYQLHLPRIGELPELEGVEKAAFVVVVEGPVTFPAFIHEAQEYKNAVCVFFGDSDPLVYADVDLQGLRR